MGKTKPATEANTEASQQAYFGSGPDNEGTSLVSYERIPADDEQPETLRPTSVELLPQTKLAEDEKAIPAGHVLLVVLKPDGTEKAGSEFTIGLKGYKRFYSNETKFKLKKKAQ